MRVYTCTSFTGHWPVGVAAVVVAEDALKAAVLLNKALKEDGLIGDAQAQDMHILPVTKERVLILRNGDY